MELRYTAKGIVKKVWPTETLTNGFKKRKVILTDDLGDNSKWPKKWCFILKQERCELADTIKEGQRVEIDFVIDGREWDGGRGIAYYTDLVALKIDVVAPAEAKPAETTAPAPAEPTQDPAASADSNPDDIPF